MSGIRRRSASLMVREVDGELLLLDTSANRIHQLNRTASFIWQRCEDVASEADLAAELALEFDVEEGQALHDVERTLSTLRALELVSPCQGNDAGPPAASRGVSQ